MIGHSEANVFHLTHPLLWVFEFWYPLGVGVRGEAGNSRLPDSVPGLDVGEA
jgi:hypothetical protein